MSHGSGLATESWKLATETVVQRLMKPTDTPNVTPDENNEEATAPLAGVQSGPDGIPEGVDTAPQSSPDDPAVPGQPENPDVVGGV